MMKRSFTIPFYLYLFYIISNGVRVKMAAFFVTYFLVDYESTDSILKIYFSDALEIERFYYFSMYAVYVCPLMFLF